MARCLSVHNLLKSILGLQSTYNSEKPQTRSDHRGIVPAIQEYDTSVDLVIFACSNFREFLILGLFTKFTIREFSFFFSSAIIIIISTLYLNSNPPKSGARPIYGAIYTFLFYFFASLF